MTFPPLLVVLCGLPGSGKSTLCQLLCSNLPQQLSSRLHISEANISVHHICLDDVLATELQRAGTPSNSFDVKIWHKSREIAHQEVQKLITNYLEGIRIILVDDNGYYRSMRQEYYRIAREAGCHYAQIYLKPPVQDCFGRNAARVTNRVPDETIQRMAAKFQEPDGAKHGWEGRTIVLVDYRQSLDEAFIAQLVDTYHDHLPPLQSQAADREGNLRNVVHQIDIRCRKFISNVISGGNAENRKEIAKHLTALKQLFLDQLRKGKYLPNPTSSQAKGGAVDELRDVFQTFEDMWDATSNDWGLFVQQKDTKCNVKG